MRGLAGGLFVWLALATGAAAAQTLAPFAVTGDRIEQPLAGQVGDIARGRALALKQESSCILCHALPEPDQRFYGNLAPPLDGVGARLSAAQLRLRLVDSRRVNPQTIMPAYHSLDGLRQVASSVQGKPILSAQEIEDLVAYLQTLK